jgi:hypothetical protein
VRCGNRVDRHEAHIVAVERILRPRIAEADKELHRIILIEGVRGAPPWKISPAT